MKNLFPLWAILAVSLLFSCKPAAKEEAEEPIPAADFNVMMVRHTVDSFDSWRPHYDAHDSVRMAYGLSTFGISRSSTDPNMVMVSLRSSDINRAKEFAALPDLKTVMDSAGVIGAPAIHYTHVVRFDSTTDSMKDRLMVIHRVKDYDAWLVVYDREGRKMRESHGLIDRALGRGIDDPNMVYLVFAVKDKEKAMARASSEELKNLMTEAGVEGQPDVFWYTSVD
jgi:hypothetical protein